MAGDAANLRRVANQPFFCTLLHLPPALVVMVVMQMVMVMQMVLVMQMEDGGDGDAANPRRVANPSPAFATSIDSHR